MEEIKCVECGTVLSKDVTECPNCGCPVSYSQQDERVEIEHKEESKNIERSNEQPAKKNRMPILSLVIGIAVCILGIMVLLKKTDAQVYDANTYDAEESAFGGDFYTEIYSASDIIVDELSDINGGISSISGLIVNGIETLYYCSGLIIIAMGLSIISISLINIGKAKK